MNKNTNGVLSIILDMRNIYTKYPNQTNHTNKQYIQIQTIALELKHKLQISNNKKQELITLLEA